MKKIFVVMLLLVSVASKTSWATGDDNIPAPALKAFQKEFPSALYAHWEKVGRTDVYIVRFVENERGMMAYVAEEGELLATIRLVSVENLPSNVGRIISKQYSGFQIGKIEELVVENSVSYLFTMQDKKVKLSLRIFSNGTYQMIKKEKINQ